MFYIYERQKHNFQCYYYIIVSKYVSIESTVLNFVTQEFAVWFHQFSSKKKAVLKKIIY